MKTVLLGDVVEIKPSKSEVRRRLKLDDEITFLPMDSLGILEKESGSEIVRKLGSVLDKYIYFGEGDVLLAKITPCFENGKLGIARNLKNGAGFGSSEFIVVRPTERILREYIFYFLCKDDFRTKGKKLMTGASGHKRLPISYVVNQKVFLPSTEEQKRIVKKLDEAFEKIDKAIELTQKNLQNSHELFDVTFQKLLSSRNSDGSKISLADVCQISSKLVDPRSKQYLALLHVGGANMESKTGNMIQLKTSREEGLISGKFQFDGEMVLYSKIRPYLMKVARPDFVGLCSADIYPLSPNLNRLNKDFLYYLLLSPDFTQYAILGSGRAGMPKVNREHLFAYKLYLPSLPDQEKIVKELDNLQAQTTQLQKLYQQKLNNLQELKKSLLDKAFKGEL